MLRKLFNSSLGAFEVEKKTHVFFRSFHTSFIVKSSLIPRKVRRVAVISSPNTDKNGHNSSKILPSPKGFTPNLVATSTGGTDMLTPSQQMHKMTTSNHSTDIATSAKSSAFGSSNQQLTHPLGHISNDSDSSEHFSSDNSLSENPYPKDIKFFTSETHPARLLSTISEVSEVLDLLSSAKAVAMDIEALCGGLDSNTPQLGSISLIQLCAEEFPSVYVIDVLTIGYLEVAECFKTWIVNPNQLKLMFDCRRDVEALRLQMNLIPFGVIDLQLYHTALEWRKKSKVRRDRLSVLCKRLTGITRLHTDDAVMAAMTVGSRPVWDIRPLPLHFMEYAASDVRDILTLYKMMDPSFTKPVKALTSKYVEHYSTGKPVFNDIDGHPSEVNTQWLESFIGPGGLCSFCSKKGHEEKDCFQKTKGVVRCTFCGEKGHFSKNCFRRSPQLHKCTACGQLGHMASSCFKTNPCTHCGGNHLSVNCHNKA